MAKIKVFDPLDIAGIYAWVQQTSTLRLLALKRGRGRGTVTAYSCKRPDAELEHELVEGGAVVVGYYTRQAPVGQLMADIGTALEQR